MELLFQDRALFGKRHVSFATRDLQIELIPCFFPTVGVNADALASAYKVGYKPVLMRSFKVAQHYGVATISRLLQMLGLFWRI